MGTPFKVYSIRVDGWADDVEIHDSVDDEGVSCRYVYPDSEGRAEICFIEHDCEGDAEINGRMTKDEFDSLIDLITITQVILNDERFRDMAGPVAGAVLISES